GRILYLHTLTESLPPAAGMDRETCYLGFEIDFDSAADKQTIENVFEFVREESEIRVLAPSSRVSEYVSLIADLPEQAGLLGEILVQGGALTRTELNQIVQQQKTGSAPQTPIGTLLVKEKVVHPPVVAAALAKQKQRQERKQHDQ